MLYKNRFGTINILDDVSIKEGTIGLSMSGGADSTMLCYLLAKTIQTQGLNLSIQPYNGYDLWAVNDSAGLPNIIQYIRKKFPIVNLQWPISVVFDTKGAYTKDKDKNTYIRPLIEKLTASSLVDIVIQGVCLGPPIEVQKTFTSGDMFRQPGCALWDEIESAKNFAPFKSIDKRFILQCYKDFEELDLLNITNSCTRPIGNCGECWWCQERYWAFNRYE